MMGRGQEKMAFLEYYLEEFVEKGKEQRLSPMFDCDEAKMMDTMLEGLLEVSNAVLEMEDYEVSEIWALVPRGWDILRAVTILHKTDQQQEAAILLRTFWEHMVITLYVVGAPFTYLKDPAGKPDLDSTDRRVKMVSHRQHLNLYKLNSLREVTAYNSGLRDKFTADAEPPVKGTQEALDALKLLHTLLINLQSDIRKQLRKEPWLRHTDEGLDFEFDPDKWIDSSVRSAFWRDATAWALKYAREQEIVSDDKEGYVDSAEGDKRFYVFPEEIIKMFEDFLRKTDDQPRGMYYGYTSALVHSLYVLPWTEALRIRLLLAGASMFLGLTAICSIDAPLAIFGVDAGSLDQGSLRVTDSLQYNFLKLEIPSVWDGDEQRFQRLKLKPLDSIWEDTP